jgi:hypothetical protein
MQYRVLHIHGTSSLLESLVENNNCGTVSCIYSEIYTSSSGWETRSIVGNHFVGNRGSHIVEIASTYGTLARFSNNTMTNNSVNTPSTGGAFTYNGMWQGNYNIFNNPQISYDLRVMTPTAMPDQNFTLNYWGTADEAIVVTRIYDVTDDSQRAKALYLPYLLSTDPSDLSPSETTLSFIGPNSTIAGETTEDLHFKLEDSPFTAIGTVIVGQGFSLTIDPGVVILFQPSASELFLHFIVVQFYFD